MKFISFFSMRMQKILEVYLKDAMQMSEKHEVYFIFFKANAENLRDLPQKSTNKSKKYINLTNN